VSSTTLTAGGFRVHAVDDPGGEPPLVLVHSSGLSSRQWAELRLTLAGEHRIVAPDLVGYGRTDAWTRDRPFSFEIDLEVVLAALELAATPAVLVGHSYGGFLALQAALARPERVAAIVVHEPVAWGVLYSAREDELVRRFESIDDDGLFFDEGRGGTDPWFERFIGFWNGPGAWGALPEDRREAFLRVGHKVFDEVRALCEDRTSHEAYRAIAVPTIVTCGQSTPDLEKRVCEIVAGEIPGAELRRIPGGHMAPLTHARGFFDAIAEMAGRARSPSREPGGGG
jgi:pimeloyl-ACP methyl ester carboxylesterase